MKTIVVYPIPFDAWLAFEPFVKRFTDTYKFCPPGVDCEVHVMCCWGKPIDRVREMFYGMKTVFHEYNADGCDIGSAQALAHMWGGSDCFMVCMNSRAYFYRKGWLRRYVDAHDMFGDALYGAFGSWEGGNPHICARGYALRASSFKEYPHRITTREKGEMFESSRQSLSAFMRDQDKDLIQITWDSFDHQEEWRKGDNKFRNGNQEQCLMWDRHTEIWFEAKDAEKRRLTAEADPPVFIPPPSPITKGQDT